VILLAQHLSSVDDVLFAMPAANCQIPASADHLRAALSAEGLEGETIREIGTDM
jgi:hypothetical protein